MMAFNILNNTEMETKKSNTSPLEKKKSINCQDLNKKIEHKTKFYDTFSAVIFLKRGKLSLCLNI